MNKEEFELTVKLTVEQQKQSDIIEKYLLDNHIDIYCRTKRTHIREWVLNQNKDDGESDDPGTDIAIDMGR